MRIINLRIISIFIVLGLFLSMANVQAEQIRQTENYKVEPIEIMIDSAIVSHPETIDHAGTVYVSLLNIMDLFMRFGIRSDWNGQALFISTKGPIQYAVPNFQSGVKGGIYLNGELISKASFIVYYDPKIENWTPFLSMKPIIKIFDKFGLTNFWNNGEWDFSTNVEGSKFVAPNALPIQTLSDLYTSGPAQSKGKPVAVARVENDQTFWHRSDQRLYIGAQTNLIEKPGELGQSLLQLKPNQTIYLYAYTENLNTDNPKNKWFVNSPDASITPVADSNFMANGFHVSLVKFTAKKPGIYTVQAEWGGTYSIPMVVVVGFNQLPYHPMNIPITETGIQPLPKDYVGSHTQTVTDYTYNTGDVKDGWLPVAGATPIGTSSVIIDLKDENNSNLEWQYQLPVDQKGNYGASVRVPFEGSIEVNIYPNGIQQLNYMFQSGTAPSSISSYVVNNTVSTTEQQRDLFASSFLNYNMNAALVQAAETLYENAPSQQTAVEAISNFVSEKISTDWPEYLDSFWFENASGVWDMQIGTFGDIVHLTAAMLRAVGLPTEIVQGTVTPNFLISGPQAQIFWATKKPLLDDSNFTWLTTQAGSQVLQFDPSFAVLGDIGNNRMITNEFFNSGSLMDTHISGKNYSFYEGIY